MAGQRSSVRPSTVTQPAIMRPLTAAAFLFLLLLAWSYLSALMQISEVKTELTGLKAVVEKRHENALHHSDENKTLLLNVINEIADSLRIDREETLNEAMGISREE